MCRFILAGDCRRRQNDLYVSIPTHTVSICLQREQIASSPEAAFQVGERTSADGTLLLRGRLEHP